MEGLDRFLDAQNPGNLDYILGKVTPCEGEPLYFPFGDELPEASKKEDSEVKKKKPKRKIRKKRIQKSKKRTPAITIRGLYAKFHNLLERVEVLEKTIVSLTK